MSRQRRPYPPLPRAALKRWATHLTRLRARAAGKRRQPEKPHMSDGREPTGREREAPRDGRPGDLRLLLDWWLAIRRAHDTGDLTDLSKLLRSDQDMPRGPRRKLADLFELRTLGKKRGGQKS